MSTSAKKPKIRAKNSAPRNVATTRPTIRRAFVPTTALARTAEFDDDVMRVYFTDGRILSVPLVWFPTLWRATPRQRADYEIGGGGVSLHWPKLDEDLSIAGLMAGVDQRSG